MARQSKAEQELNRIKELARERQKRYLENHKRCFIGASVSEEVLNRFEEKLKKDGLTKTDFILDAIMGYLEEE